MDNRVTSYFTQDWREIIVVRATITCIFLTFYNKWRLQAVIWLQKTTIKAHWFIQNYFFFQIYWQRLVRLLSTYCTVCIHLELHKLIFNHLSHKSANISIKWVNRRHLFVILNQSLVTNISCHLPNILNKRVWVNLINSKIVNKTWRSWYC